MASGYEVVITADSQADMAALRAYDLRIVVKAIEDHLTHQPKQVSRSRIRKLTRPAISQYRLRVRDYRVYYDVDDEDKRVIVLQVYEKGRSTTPHGGRR